MLVSQAIRRSHLFTALCWFKINFDFSQYLMFRLVVRKVPCLPMWQQNHVFCTSRLIFCQWARQHGYSHCALSAQFTFKRSL